MSNIVKVISTVRLLAFPASIAGLIRIGGTAGVGSGFLLAEWLAFLTGLMMTNRAQRLPLWHGVGRFLFFLTGSALLLIMVLFFGQSWWGALALTSAVIFVWAIVLTRSAWGPLADGLMFEIGSESCRERVCQEV